MEALWFGVALLVPGLGLLGIFARGVWIRQVVKARGVTTTGWVSGTSTGREGTITTIQYRSEGGKLHRHVYPYQVAAKGTETEVRYDPRNPDRAVVHIARHAYFFWLVMAAPLLYFAVSAILEGVQLTLGS